MLGLSTTRDKVIFCIVIGIALLMAANMVRHWEEAWNWLIT